METLALKLVLTPLLILAASLASRRWGDSVGGWFVGLPLTSGPVCFFLALDQGAGFAASASLGCLAGAAGEAGFGLAYCWAARHRGWPAALAVASIAFALAGVALAEAALPLPALVLVACGALGLALVLLPQIGERGTATAAPRWDIPARMAMATGLVLTLTGLAPWFGATLSGLLATYPAFAAVLTAFSHHQRGAAAATQVVRGLLVGLFGFAGFFAALAAALPRFGIGAGFALAAIVALAIQACSWRLVRAR